MPHAVVIIAKAKSLMVTSSVFLRDSRRWMEDLTMQWSDDRLVDEEEKNE